MNKKGQAVSLFIVVGVILLISFGVFLYLRTAIHKQPSEISTDFESQKVQLASQIEDCIRIETKEAVFLYGVSKESSNDEIKQYLEENLEDCVDFETFEERGLDINKEDVKVNVNTDENYLSIDVNYPITMSKETSSSKIEGFNYNIEIKTEKYLKTKDGFVLEDSVIELKDAGVKLEIPKGTLMLDLSNVEKGKEIPRIDKIKIETKNKAKDDYKVVGEIVYDLLEDDTWFYPAVKLSIAYDEKLISKNYDEDELRISYFDKTLNKWVELDTQIDKNNNVLTTHINHFTTSAKTTEKEIVISDDGLSKCEDSDGGLNYEIKGTTKTYEKKEGKWEEVETEIDYCMVKSEEDNDDCVGYIASKNLDREGGEFVNEYICSKDVDGNALGHGSPDKKECKCIDGACVGEVDKKVEEEPTEEEQETTEEVSAEDLGEYNCDDYDIETGKNIVTCQQDQPCNAYTSAYPLERCYQFNTDVLADQICPSGTTLVPWSCPGDHYFRCCVRNELIEKRTEIIDGIEFEIKENDDDQVEYLINYEIDDETDYSTLVMLSERISDILKKMIDGIFDGTKNTNEYRVQLWQKGAEVNYKLSQTVYKNEIDENTESKVSNEDNGESANWVEVCGDDVVVDKDDIEAKNNGGQTALIYAAWHGHTDCVKALINARADVNAKGNFFGRTALIYAAKWSHTDCAKALIDAEGIDVNAQTDDGMTALMYVARNGKLKCLNALLTAGADVNAENNDGWTALIYAAGWGRIDCVNVLLSADDIDVNAENNDGWTALIYAAHYGHTDCVKALINARADVNAKNNNGDTAMDLANNDEIKDILGAAENK